MQSTVISNAVNAIHTMQFWLNIHLAYGSLSAFSAKT